MQLLDVAGHSDFVSVWHGPSSFPFPSLKNKIVQPFLGVEGEGAGKEKSAWCRPAWGYSGRCFWAGLQPQRSEFHTTVEVN